MATHSLSLKNSKALLTVLASVAVVSVCYVSVQTTFLGKIFQDVQVVSQVEAQTTTKTFTLGEIPLSNPEIINPQRGYYKWRGSEQVPEARPAQTMYDRFEWRTLEPTKGNYNFAPIDTQIATAKSNNQKYAFRIRDLVPQEGIAIPDYMRPYSWVYGGFVVPDYNSPFYQERAKLLIEKLAEKYDGNTDIEYLDMPMFGKWGEIHLQHIDYGQAPNGITYPTQQTQRKLVDFFVDAFPNTQLVMLKGDAKAGDIVTYALNHPRLTIPAGVRNDSMGIFPGGVDIFSQITTRDQWDAVSEQWKVGPHITEYGGRTGGYAEAVDQVKRFHVSALSNGNWAETWGDLSTEEKANAVLAGKVSGYRFVLRNLKAPTTLPQSGSFQVLSSWSNVGVAPAYQNWRAQLQLRKPGSTTVVWESPLGVRFRCSSKTDVACLLPTKSSTGIDTPKTYSNTFNLNGVAARGEYDLVVKVVQNDPIWPTMKLANTGKTTDDAYLLGTISVGVATGVSTILPTQTEAPIVVATATPTPTARPLSGSLGGESLNIKIQTESYTTASRTMETKKRGNAVYVNKYQPDDWMTYTFTAKTSGKYVLKANYSTRSRNASLSFQLDAQTPQQLSLSPVALWYQFKDSEQITFDLTAGSHVLKMTNSGGSSVDVNYVELVKVSDNAVSNVGVSIPGSIEVENFDKGGQKVGYYDNTEGNYYKNNLVGNESADVNKTQSGMTYVGNFKAGEWMNYSVNVQTSKEYALRLKYATKIEGSRIAILVNGRKVKEVVLPLTEEWLEPQTLTLRNINISRGKAVIRLQMISGHSVLDSFELE